MGVEVRVDRPPAGRHGLVDVPDALAQRGDLLRVRVAGVRGRELRDGPRRGGHPRPLRRLGSFFRARRLRLDGEGDLSSGYLRAFSFHFRSSLSYPELPLIWIRIRFDKIMIRLDYLLS